MARRKAEEQPKPSATPKRATTKKPSATKKQASAKKASTAKKPSATPKPRPVSPINGQPVPTNGKVIQAGEEARQLGRKGGKKSAAIRAARKSLREELLELLTVDITDKNGKLMKTQTAISASMIKQALTGNTKAFEIIRDTIGEKPIDKVMVTEIDKATIEEVESIVLGAEDADKATGN